MEGGCIRTISAALVAQLPGLAGCSCPRVDLDHLLTGQQSTTPLEQCGVLLWTGAVVTTVVTCVLLGTRTIGHVVVVTKVAGVAITVELTCDSFARTLTVTSAMTTVGTRYMLRPLVAGGCVGTFVAIITVTLVGVWLTRVTHGCG